MARVPSACSEEPGLQSFAGACDPRRSELSSFASGHLAGAAEQLRRLRERL